VVWGSRWVFLQLLIAFGMNPRNFHVLNFVNYSHRYIRYVNVSWLMRVSSDCPSHAQWQSSLLQLWTMIQRNSWSNINIYSLLCSFSMLRHFCESDVDSSQKLKYYRLVLALPVSCKILWEKQHKIHVSDLWSPFVTELNNSPI
jgi:hypothetical protein